MEFKKAMNEKLLILEDTKRYKTVAIKLAIIYISLNEISVINPLCMHSLNTFLNIIKFAVTIPYRKAKQHIGSRQMIDLVPLAMFKYVIAGKSYLFWTFLYSVKYFNM